MESSPVFPKVRAVKQYLKQYLTFIRDRITFMTWDELLTPWHFATPISSARNASISPVFWPPISNCVASKLTNCNWPTPHWGLGDLHPLLSCGCFRPYIRRLDSLLQFYHYVLEDVRIWIWWFGEMELRSVSYPFVDDLEGSLCIRFLKYHWVVIIVFWSITESW